MKKIISIILCVSIVISCIPYKVNAESIQTQNIEENNKEENEKIINEDIINEPIIITVTNGHTVNNIVKQYKFHYSKGHGFAAEQGNNFIDRLKWKNAKVVGNDNLKNGPDRLILNRDGSIKTLIQDKYYKTANGTINACFDENGIFKYMDGDIPMNIEVPKDQYEKAVELMKQKITEGKVPGVSDPNEAENIVKPGHLTYKQAVNLSKPLTKESLLYDAANGVVSAGAGFGISTVLTFVVLSINGEERDIALKKSAIEGVKTGGKVFAISVIAGQLTKAGALELFKPTSEALVKALGDKFARSLLEAFSVEIVDETTESITKQAARILRSQVLVAAIETIVFTTPDAIDLFRGRISGTQFVKNLITTVGSVATGTAGFLAGSKIGTLIYPGVGTVIGGVIGGIIGGLGGSLGLDWLGDKVVQDDAELMYNIFSERFSVYCDDYLVNEQEAQNILDKLSKNMDEKFYKDMYESENRIEFIDGKLEPLFEEEIMKRPDVAIPTDEEMRQALKAELKGVVFIH